MRMVSFRTDSNKYRDLADYATDQGVTVSEVLNRLVDNLILGESTIDLNGSNVMALKGRVERLEELLTSGEDNPGDGKSPTRKEEETSEKEVAEIVAEVMDEREKELARGIAKGVAEHIGEVETEITQRINELFGLTERFDARLEQLNEVQARLNEIVVPLKEQVEKCKVHTTAEDMIACPDCGPFFLDSVRIAIDKLAEARALEEESPGQSAQSEEEPPRAWLIMAPGSHLGFKWDEEREYYYLLTTDQRLADEWSKKRDIKVVELAGLALEEYEQAHPPGS